MSRPSSSPSASTPTAAARSSAARSVTARRRRSGETSCGIGFAETLAGGAAGAKTNSPVLLVAPNSLPAETAAALRTLQPRNMGVLGGTSAVSNTVLEQLRGYTTGGVTRIAGGDRYATAARVVQTFWTTATPVVYLATGRNLPDALASQPPAGTRPHCYSSSRPACRPRSSGSSTGSSRRPPLCSAGPPPSATPQQPASCAPHPHPHPHPRRHRHLLPHRLRSQLRLRRRPPGLLTDHGDGVQACFATSLSDQAVCRRPKVRSRSVWSVAMVSSATSRRALARSAHRRPARRGGAAAVTGPGRCRRPQNHSLVV